LLLDFGKYVVLTAVMQLILYIKEKNAILFTYPLEVCSLDCLENVVRLCAFGLHSCFCLYHNQGLLFL